MKATWGGFHSPIAPHARDFLALKRAFGRRFETEEAGLRLLDRFLTENGVSGIDQISPVLLDRFLSSRSRTTARSFNQLLGILRRFFNYMVLHDHIARSPVQAGPRRRSGQRIPFIFTAEEIQRLFAAVRSNGNDTHGAMMWRARYETIFAFLVGLGLRIGEVSQLEWRDVCHEDRTLLIRRAKFSKSRLIPLGPRIARQLSDYRHVRETALGPLSGDTPLFSATLGRPLNPKTISQTFRDLMPRLGLGTPPGVADPTVHCLRHTFAVRVLLHWYRTGMNPAEHLPELSTFLGHTGTASTAVYLTITSELLQEAGQRFERLVMPLTLESPR